MYEADIITVLADIYRDSPDAFPTVSREAIAAAEKELGFPLPPLLKELYARVGNGGMGPNEGTIVGLEGGWPQQGYGRPVPQMYHDFRGFEETYLLYEGVRSRQWPEYLVPFCWWSNFMYSCVLCDSPDAPVYVLDFDCICDWMEKVGPISNDDPRFQDFTYPVAREAASLEEWMRRWAIGFDMRQYAADVAAVKLP